MHHLSRSVSKRTLSSVLACYRNGFSSFSMASRQPYRSSILPQIVDKSPRDAIPSDFLKWRSLGSVRTSKFASGFTPLKQKPLDSIIDLERAKHKSAEELAEIWDDVSNISTFFFSYFDSFKCIVGFLEIVFSLEFLFGTVVNYIGHAI